MCVGGKGENAFPKATQLIAGVTLPVLIPTLQCHSFVFVSAFCFVGYEERRKCVTSSVDLTSIKRKRPFNISVRFHSSIFLFVHLFIRYIGHPLLTKQWEGRVSILKKIKRLLKNDAIFKAKWFNIKTPGDPPLVTKQGLPRWQISTTQTWQKSNNLQLQRDRLAGQPCLSVEKLTLSNGETRTQVVPNLAWGPFPLFETMATFKCWDEF